MLEKFNNQTRILTRKIQKLALNFKLKRHFLTSIPSIQTDSTEENHEQNKNKELKSLKRRESEISCGIGAGTSQPNHSAALLSHWEFLIIPSEEKLTQNSKNPNPKTISFLRTTLRVKSFYIRAALKLRFGWAFVMGRHFGPLKLILPNRPNKLFKA